MFGFNKVEILIIRRIWGILLIGVLLFLANKLVASDSFEDDKKGNVLLLNSYHKGYLWTDEITRGVEEALNGHVNDINIEYMDTKRQFTESYKLLLAEMLRLKHEKHHYDIIITSDDNAFNYLKRFRDSIFGNVPLVFCGVNYLQEEELNGISNLTGISEEADIKNNLELIERIHPECKRIVVITDNTTTGKRIQDEARYVNSARDPSKPKLELLFDVNSKELIDTLQKLSPTDIVLHSIFFQDREGAFLEFDKGARLICNNSSVPVYGVWNFSFGYGIVGGYLTTGFEQGYMAGQKVLEILSGKSAGDIPIHYKPITSLKFDYRQLEYYEISTQNLPIDSEIFYQPVSFIKKYKKQIRNLAIIVVFLIVFIIILTYALTRSQLMKRELQKNQKHLRYLVSNIPGIVYRCLADVNKSLIFLSENINKITGYDVKDFIETNTKTFTDIIHNEDLEYVSAEVRKALDKNTPWELTYRMVKKSGEVIWVYEKGRGILNEDNKYEFLDGLILDITDKKEAEMEIIAANEELKATTDALKESNAELIIALEEAKRSKELEIANRKLKEKQKELEELHFELKESHEETQQLNEELSATNESLYLQKEELEATLEKLKETQTQLVQSEKMASVGILTAGIAHEINNPLNFIHGGRLSLKNYISNNLNEHEEKVTPFLDIIETGVKRAAEIVKSLNRFNRKGDTYDEVCDINFILNNCLIMLHNQLKYKVTLVKKYTHESTEVLGNEGKLHQVFLNIITNSIQAIEETGEITISSEVKNENVIVRIIDNGCGISKENVDKITDPFFTTKDPGKGTGLGLSISYQIIKDINGSLKFKSELNKGTETKVIIPQNKK